MTEKLNAFVCDKCRKCCGKVDGYPIENGWNVYLPHFETKHYCPECYPEAVKE